MAKKLSIQVKTVPTQGRAKNKTVEVAPSGASVKEVCAAADIATDNMDFEVDGRPADLDTHVTAQDVLQAKERGKAAVQVSERPRGS